MRHPGEPIPAAAPPAGAPFHDPLASELRDMLADARRHLEQDTAYHRDAGLSLLNKAIALADELFGPPDPAAAGVRVAIEVTARRIAVSARETAGFHRMAAHRVWHHDATFPRRSAWRSHGAPFGERTKPEQRLSPALVEYLDDLLELPVRVADQLPVPPAGGA